MAVVIEGVGKVKPDDKLEGKTDGQLRTIFRTLNNRDKLTASQQSVLDNAQKMLTARSNFRQKYNKSGTNLTGATLGQLRARRTEAGVEKFILKLKEQQKATRATNRSARKNTGEPF